MINTVVNRLFNNIASVRDYIVNEALDSGQDLKILLDSEKKEMVIKHENIRERMFQINPEKFKSRYNKQQEYTLVDFKWEEPSEETQKILDLFNGKEADMSFDLAGYQPEVVKDNDFEVMTGKNNICIVNSAKIEDVEAGERDGREYDAYTRLRYELEVISEKFKKRKVWKSYNLDSQERTGKAKKTPIEKLADAFFTIGLEFSDAATLNAAIEKFAEMTLTVSFSKFTPKGEKEPRQLHTIISVAPESWDTDAKPEDNAEAVKF